MASPFEVSDKQAQIVSAAANDHDGLTIANVMDEVGSCGWSSLISKVNRGRGFEEKLSLKIHSSGGHVDAEIAENVNRPNVMKNDQLVLVHDKECAKK